MIYLHTHMDIIYIYIYIYIFVLGATVFSLGLPEAWKIEISWAVNT